MYQITHKIADLRTGACSVESSGESNGGTEKQKIACGGRTADAYFSTTPVAGEGTQYTYQYGVTPQTLSVTLMPDGSCQNLEMNRIRTRVNPETVYSLSCNTDGECFSKQSNPEHEREPLSPEDSQDLCRVATALIQGLDRAITGSAR